MEINIPNSTSLMDNFERQSCLYLRYLAATLQFQEISPHSFYKNYLFQHYSILNDKECCESTDKSKGNCSIKIKYRKFKLLKRFIYLNESLIFYLQSVIQ